MTQVLLSDLCPGAAQESTRRLEEFQRRGLRVLDDAQAHALRVGQRIRISNDMWGRFTVATVIRVHADPRGGSPYFDIAPEDRPGTWERIDPVYFKVGPQLHYFGSDAPDKTRTEVAALLAGIYRAEEAAAEEKARADEKAKAEEAAGRCAVEKMGLLDSPAWIVATLKQDVGDSLTDYYASKNVRTVVLAASAHKRDLFKEMRQAAARAAGVSILGEDAATIAALADAPADWEHREKYSMGHGYYLGRYRYSGWEISKETTGPHGMGTGLLRAIGRGDHALALPIAPVQEKAEPAQESAAVAIAPENPTGFTTVTHRHTMKNRDMAMVVPLAMLGKARWLEITEKAKAFGGWWSKAWGPAPGGWAFWADAGGQDKAAALLAWIGGGEGPDGTPADAPETAGPSKTTPAPSAKGHPKAAKVRALGEKMAQDATACAGRNRLENTPKRQAQAASARIDADRATRAGGFLLAWADAADAGTLPAILADAPTKAEALAIARKTVDHAANGWHARPFETDTWADTSPRAVALRALAPEKSDPVADRARAKADALVRLRWSDRPGFFPTPAGVARLLVEQAGDLSGKTILEPSAGIGSLIEAALEAGADAEKITAIELCPDLAEFLREHGPKIGKVDADNFIDWEPNGSRFGVALMNPPYERDAWVYHTIRADALCSRVYAVLPATAEAYAERGGSEAKAAWKAFIGARADRVRWVSVPDRAFARADAFRQTGTNVVILCIE